MAVRPYDVGDRAAVRDVCYRTGYMGEPIDWQWRDESSFADLFCGYYPDGEPESAFVVEAD
ncbi:MAG TPA: GNAT family acetyltransferase, partial [Acidimicrobiia bacterium]|nr:GNAT family acetyltransferase [Acidimicrobiia bacterium]